MNSVDITIGVKAKFNNADKIDFIGLIIDTIERGFRRMP